MARSIRRLAVAPIGAVLGIFLAPIASATILPPGFDIHVHGPSGVWKASSNEHLFSSNSEPAGQTVWNVQPLVGSTWKIDGYQTDFTYNPSQTNAFTVTNTSGSTQTFTITITTPGSLPGPTIIFGSITGALTDNTLTGATFGAPVGSSVYTALVNGTQVETLWNDPFSVSTGSPPYTESLGQDSFANLPGPAVISGIAITHHFTLTAGDSVTINSALHVIPGPGGLALLAGCLFFKRRRRKHLGGPLKLGWC